MDSQRKGTSPLFYTPFDPSSPKPGQIRGHPRRARGRTQWPCAVPAGMKSRHPTPQRERQRPRSEPEFPQLSRLLVGASIFPYDLPVDHWKLRSAAEQERLEQVREIYGEQSRLTRNGSGPGRGPVSLGPHGCRVRRNAVGRNAANRSGTMSPAADLPSSATARSATGGTLVGGKTKGPTKGPQSNT